MKTFKVFSVMVVLTLLMTVSVGSTFAASATMDPCDRRFGQRLHDCDNQVDSFVVAEPTREPVDDFRQPVPNPDPEPIDDLEAPELEQPVLCHMEVGFDADLWGAEGMNDIDYGWFYFEATPWEPLPAGTPIWGIAMVNPSTPLADPEDVVAVATDMSLYDEALESDYAGAYNWPTPYGGIESGGNIWYRNEIDYGDSGECGPIVGIDDFTIGGGSVLEAGTYFDYVIGALD